MKMVALDPMPTPVVITPPMLVLVLVLVLMLPLRQMLLPKTALQAGKPVVAIAW
jgi:hypothetical protein